MPSLPDPLGGLSWRAASPDDADALGRLHAAVYEADGGYMVVASEYRDDLTHPGNDPSVDSLVAIADSGDIAAYGLVFMTGGDRSKHRAFLMGHVHPGHRRRGVGTTLLRWMEDRAAERFDAIGDDLRRVIRIGAYESMTDRIRLFERSGYDLARYFIEMIRDLSEPFPDLPRPQGIEIREWSDTGRDDALGIHNSAFQDHWGSEPVTPEAWQHRFRDTFFLPDDSLIAYDGDLPVGYLHSTMYPHDFESRGRTEAWVEGLATIRSHRKRGVASALILEAMARHREKGLDFAALGADADNPTGAVGLYDRLGFVVEKTSMAFTKYPA